MEEFLASFDIGNGSTIHIAKLAKETVEEAGAGHLGCHGYFLFEVNDTPKGRGLDILAKVHSIEAGFRLMDIWRMKLSSSH